MSRQSLALYGLTLLAMLPLDIIWLAFVARTFYQSQIGALLLDSPSIVPAVAFYLLYGAGIVFFALLPAARAGNWTTALLNGAFLGLVAYGTYDLSNLATLKGFSTTVALVDLAWGTVMTATAASGTFLVARSLKVI